MIAASNLSNDFALDVQGVNDLRLKARTDPEAALKAAAQQFEAVFMQMMLKSMRDTIDQDGMFDSQDTRQYTAMLDQQLAQSLSGKGLGLAEAMVRQLRGGTPATASADAAAYRAAAYGNAGSPATQLSATPDGPPVAAGEAWPVTAGAAAAPAAAATTGGSGSTGSHGSTPAAFVNKLWPHAAEASRTTGIPPTFMIGHAALETGWGRGEMRGADGSNSHNLFGIKAGRGWNGATVDVVTTEYVNGVAQKSVEKFRAYGSYAEAFQDYARLLKGSPRYAAAVNSGNDPAAFAMGLQQAGYATDPMYADKLNRILQGNTLRQSLMG